MGAHDFSLQCDISALNVWLGGAEAQADSHRRHPMNLSDPIPMGPGFIRSAIGAGCLVLAPFILSFARLLLTGEV